MRVQVSVQSVRCSCGGGVGTACHKVCLVRRYKKNIHGSACVHVFKLTCVYALVTNQRALLAFL